MPTIESSPSPNYSSRGGRRPIAITDHITAGKFPGCLEWMKNPLSEASANYLITKTGRIIKMVDESLRAWANGVVKKPTWTLYDGTNPNSYTISIEHEGQPDDIMPEKQYQASLWLHKDIIERWQIPIDTEHIIGHYRIDSVDRANCPGPGFPWARLFEDLKGESDVLDVAVLLFTKEDFWAGIDVSVKHNNCPIIVRTSTGLVPKEATSAKKLIVVGGPSTGHSNEILLSGNDKYDTAAAVGKYLG